jgi:large subunit ribosomal protein L4
MEIKVLSTTGAETGRSVSLPESVFGIEPNDHSIYLSVRQYLANQRQGTHKAKERAEITGSTKKIKKQKGTGTARAGSIKSPVFRGGGRVFGPRPRDYGFKLNKKEKALARRSALTYKAQDQAILVLEDFNMEAPKTKEFKSILKALSLDNTKTLVVTKDTDRNTYLSARNLKGTKVVPAAALNTYEILNAERVVFAEGAMETVSNF